ncbi:DUF2163 domain-containing protein [Candidatus Lariskella endosymbiont of Epinotia ramella]|uniref:DUF2163 domain-containing protein n=1 Tax=Candidatus Lariskella endosymbiont of Epinotia ramella TaxID=3066224 RepID=UPI0030CBD4AD
MTKYDTFLKNKTIDEVITLTTCIQLKLKDGTIKGFTEHNEDIIIDNILYKKESGFSRSVIARNNNLIPDNCDIYGMLRDESIKIDDILRGKYDNAEVSMFLVDYNDLNAGKFQIKRGWIGEVRANENKFIAEVRGVMQAFASTSGQIYSAMCRASFGDSRCKIDQRRYMLMCNVIAVENNSTFTYHSISDTTEIHKYGYVKFINGNNFSFTSEIKSLHNNKIILCIPAYHQISVKDKFELYAGCDNSIKMCHKSYNNVINYRGEPHVPTVSSIISTTR